MPSPRCVFAGSDNDALWSSMKCAKEQKHTENHWYVLCHLMYLQSTFVRRVRFTRPLLRYAPVNVCKIDSLIFQKFILSVVRLLCGVNLILCREQSLSMLAYQKQVARRRCRFRRSFSFSRRKKNPCRHSLAFVQAVVSIAAFATCVVYNHKCRLLCGCAIIGERGRKTAPEKR